MNNQCPIPGCRVEQVTFDVLARLQVTARGLGRGGCCPGCGKKSRAVHGRCRRRPADLPSLGRAVRVSLRMRRLHCRSVACPRPTFAEGVSQLAARFARRSRRLAVAGGRSGAALGGEAGARLRSRLSTPASAGAVLRLRNRLPLPLQTDPRVVGADDGAKRRGRSYGTIAVDLERRQAVDLLPDRTAAASAAWLQQRPGIEVVARDLAETRSVCGWLDGARQRHRNRRVIGRPGGRSVASAGQPAPGCRALACRCTWPASAAAGPA